MQNKRGFLKLVLLFFMSVPLFSNDLLSQYRVGGIGSIEKDLDTALMQKEYWSGVLQNRDTTFGYIEAYPNVLACDKSQSTLTLYRHDENRNYKVTKEYGAFTGQAKGDKQIEGDLKTPVGVYELTKKLTNLDSFYGPMAFVTSYPNVYDIYKGKNGYGIWIHGLPTEQARDKYTRGCIAINNLNIECLDRNIDIEKTVLIINETQVIKNTPKEELSEILAQLYAWRYAWKYSNIEDYLNFYSEDFRRFDGMNLDTFTKYKTRIFNKEERKSIIFNDINVIPYPNLEQTYQITFKEIYKSDSFSFTGNKVLIVSFKENKLKIITEK